MVYLARSMSPATTTTERPKRGRPSSASLVDKALHLRPIAGASEIAELLGMRRSELYRIVEHYQKNHGDALPSKLSIPKWLPRYSKACRLQFLRDDVVAWIRGDTR